MNYMKEIHHFLAKVMGLPLLPLTIFLFIFITCMYTTEPDLLKPLSLGNAIIVCNILGILILPKDPSLPISSLCSKHSPLCFLLSLFLFSNCPDTLNWGIWDNVEIILANTLSYHHKAMCDKDLCLF